MKLLKSALKFAPPNVGQASRLPSERISARNKRTISSAFADGAGETPALLLKRF
jgi:hypothetical protein